MRPPRAGETSHQAGSGVSACARKYLLSVTKFPTWLVGYFSQSPWLDSNVWSYLRVTLLCRREKKSSRSKTGSWTMAKGLLRQLQAYETEMISMCLCPPPDWGLLDPRGCVWVIIATTAQYLIQNTCSLKVFRENFRIGSSAFGSFISVPWV